MSFRDIWSYSSEQTLFPFQYQIWFWRANLPWTRLLVKTLGYMWVTAVHVFEDSLNIAFWNWLCPSCSAQGTKRNIGFYLSSAVSNQRAAKISVTIQMNCVGLKNFYGFWHTDHILASLKAKPRPSQSMWYDGLLNLIDKSRLCSHCFERYRSLEGHERQMHNGHGNKLELRQSWPASKQHARNVVFLTF